MTMTEPDAPMTLPRTERPDAPAYLQKYLDRESRGSRPGVATPARPEDETPLYLRRFRDRRSGGYIARCSGPSVEGADVGATRAWAEVTRTKGSSPSARIRPRTRSPTSTSSVTARRRATPRVWTDPAGIVAGASSRQGTRAASDCQDST